MMEGRYWKIPRPGGRIEYQMARPMPDGSVYACYMVTLPSWPRSVVAMELWRMRRQMVADIAARAVPR